MNYERTFHLHSCHFNTQAEYDSAWEWFSPTSLSRAMDWRSLLTNIHGHNFELLIVFDGDPTKDGWIVDDEALEKCIAQYDRTNLSMLPRALGARERATTENLVKWIMADVLAMLGDASNIHRIRAVLWEDDCRAAALQTDLYLMRPVTS